MRRHILPVLALVAAMLAIPVTHAYAQMGGGGGGGDDEQDDAAAKKKKNSEWDDKQAPLPSLRNAGPCPYVKVLYDAARYIEMDGPQPASSAVAYSGEIQSLAAGCKYEGADPIQMRIEILFAFGKGPRAAGDAKAFPYWVAVTDRNRSVLAKEYFSMPVKFPNGQDRVLMTQTLEGVTIPRAAQTVSGANFEVLVGFDVTPEMADFNRDGKRFRVNATGQAPAASPPPSAPPSQ